MTSLVSFEHLYRAAMRILPAGFRARFGDEMCELANARMSEARQRGTFAAMREGWVLFADLCTTAPGISPDTPPRPRNNMDIFLSDLRFSIRALARRPAFTIVAAVTLALGIGANTAIFSVVNAVLIRPIPFRDPDQLMLLNGTQGSQVVQGVSFADYVDWRARNHTFSEMGATRGQSVNLTGTGEPERLIGLFVTASAMRTIDVATAQGRLFSEPETEIGTKAPVAIVQYETWRSRFGSDPAMIGKVLNVNGMPFSVVGITAPNTQVPLGAPDIWLPMGYYPNAKGLDRGVRGVLVVGRLKTGVTMAAAQQDLNAVGKQLEQEYPSLNAGTGAQVASLREQTVGGVRQRLLIMLGAVGVVLLIACANVANLQLTRGASRARELSVRAALGAGRGRIAQQLLTESVVLSLAGGLAGIGIAFGLTKALASLLGPQLPVDAATIGIDTPVLLFALAISVATGVVFGLVPAWHASRTDLAEALRARTSGASGGAIRHTLVVVQLALSLALLASAGLLTRSLMALQRVDPGFDGSNLLTAQFRLPGAKYDSPEKIMAMFDRTTAEIRSVPGVQSVALVRASPLSGNGETFPLQVEGKPEVRPADAAQVQTNIVSPGYFLTMRIRTIAGRDVEPNDRVGSLPVVVINKSLAEATWPGESAIGKRIKLGGSDDWRTVVGVVADTKQFSLNEPQFLQAYLPHAQRAQIFTSIAVRVAGEPGAFFRPVSEAIWRVDHDQPIWRFRAMDRDLYAVTTSNRTMMWLTGMFALVALLVAAVGIYGVISYTVSQRTQEVGIRIALGASRGSVSGMVVQQGAKLVTIAVVAGLAASWGAAKILQSQLFGVKPNDLVTLAAVTVLLAGVAIVACWIPARRAARVDPMVALRSE